MIRGAFADKREGGQTWSLWRSGVFGEVEYLAKWSLWRSGVFGEVESFFEVEYLAKWSIWRSRVIGEVESLAKWSHGHGPGQMGPGPWARANVH